jgi:3-deoxy-D-manno-octulosonate 8-phosphate phosphatase (KDO 8-P phosphatase)
MTTDIKQAAQQIKLLILDVDGVLTDGKIYVDPTQESLKAFHVQDGLGIKLLQQSGITVAIITGKESTMVSVRAKTLGIEHVYQNQPNKVAAFYTLLTKFNIKPEHVA